jgi:hypothetical protein
MWNEKDGHQPFEVKCHTQVWPYMPKRMSGARMSGNEKIDGVGDMATSGIGDMATSASE